MKRIFCVLLALVLLTGCLQVPVGGEIDDPAATLPTAPTAAPLTLLVGGDLPLRSDSAAVTAIQRYGDLMGVRTTLSAGSPTAGLALLSATPTDPGAYVDLSTDPLLAAAALRAGIITSGNQTFYALPLGRSLYAYWADSAVLTALLGDGCLTDVQNATWTEWSLFVTTLTGWLASPAAMPVRLNGRTYTLPAQKTSALQRLCGVFALPPADNGQWGSGAAFTPALLAADRQRTSAALDGPLNGLGDAFLLELGNGVPEAEQGNSLTGQLRDGKALFARASLADLAAVCSGEMLDRLVFVPFKGSYTEADLTTEQYNLAGLTNYPILAGAGYLAIPTGADAEARRAGVAAMLWLYSSAAGEDILIDDLLLITPWDTASNTSTPGAMQIRQAESGVLPDVGLGSATASALGGAWLDLAESRGLAAWHDAAMSRLTQNEE